MRQNKYTLITWVALILGGGFLTLCSQAQSSQRMDFMRDSLNLSLTALKDKAYDIAERNNWLWGEIQIYNRDIPELKNQIHFFGQATPVFEESVQLPLEEFVSAPIPVTSYEEADYVQQQIMQLKRDIAHLNNKIQTVEGRNGPAFIQEIYPQDKQQLLGQLSNLRERISQSEIYLQSLQKKHGRRSKVYRSLLEKQNLLKKKQALLKNEMNLALREHMQLRQKIEKLGTHHEVTFEEINQNIIQLRSEGEYLEKVLERARKKVKNKAIDFSVTDEDLDRLMENLTIVQREQERLQDEYIHLTKRYEGLKRESSMEEEAGLR